LNASLNDEPGVRTILKFVLSSRPALLHINCLQYDASLKSDLASFWKAGQYFWQRDKISTLPPSDNKLMCLQLQGYQTKYVT
jgi:hypothetical protein